MLLFCFIISDSPCSVNGMNNFVDNISPLYLKSWFPSYIGMIVLFFLISKNSSIVSFSVCNLNGILKPG